MKDILGRIATKRSLTKLLMNVAEGHFRKRNVSFSIEGNWSHSSSAGIGTTNRTGSRHNGTNHNQSCGRKELWFMEVM